MELTQAQRILFEVMNKGAVENNTELIEIERYEAMIKDEEHPANHFVLAQLEAMEVYKNEAIKGEELAKEHFRKKEVEAIIDITKLYNDTELFNAYQAGEKRRTFRKKDGSVILPSNYEGVDG
jgi:hypothetical protein